MNYLSRTEADGLHNISVFFLKKHGYFSRGVRAGVINWSIHGEKVGSITIQSCINENEQYMQFIYTQTDRFSGEKTDFDYKIFLISTPCNFGGVRYWFKCNFSSNGVYCGRRVGVLYLNGKYFACRHCHNLTYNSKNLSGIFKTIGQVIGESELAKLAVKVERKYYAGKKTKRYKSYLKKQRKSDLQREMVTMNLEGLYRKRN